MKILVYGLNYFPEVTGIGKYTGEFCEWMAARGHDVRVVCAVPYYPEWKVPATYRGVLYKREVVNRVHVYRSPLYVPRHPTKTTRLIHLISFALFSIPQVFRHVGWRPELVLNVVPTLFTSPIALLAAYIFRAKPLLHIQDFELEAMTGLEMKRVGKMSCQIEAFVMNKFLSVSTISYAMVERAKRKLKDGRSVEYFPNWVDTEFITTARFGELFRQLWGIGNDKKVVLYAGNIGQKQGLNIVIDAAQKLSGLKDVIFVFVGDGAAYAAIKQYSDSMGLKNVHFYPLQPYETLPELMAFADIHLVVQRKGVADSVMPSKLSTILASGGTALITASPESELGRICQQNSKIARIVLPEDAEEFADVLGEMLMHVDVNRRRPNYDAREYAVKNYDKNAVIARFEKELVTIVGN